ncbi:MAG TPA: hypothetical protein QF509_00490 [Rhodospirillales bacterium]|nr:hypothetical protein [Rhodospirillales bacterium]
MSLTGRDTGNTGIGWNVIDKRCRRRQKGIDDNSAVSAAGEIAPGLPRAMNFSEIPVDWKRRINGLGCTAPHCLASELTVQMVASICRAGFRLRCYTVNEKTEAEILFGWGASSVFTDYPDRLLSS